MICFRQNDCVLFCYMSVLTVQFAANSGAVTEGVFLFVCLFVVLFFGGGFCVPQLYLGGSPLWGEIFAYVTAF